MVRLFRIDDADTVAVAFQDLGQGTAVNVSGDSFPLLNDVGRGHKVALVDIRSGQHVIKYGASIGTATRDIRKGELVHTGNLGTGLQEHVEYEYRPEDSTGNPFVWEDAPPLRVYKRKNGRAGIRNELWIIPTVGCVNGIAQNIIAAFQAEHTHDAVDGIFSFPHPYGCSQLGDDHERTRRVLQNIALHPNAGGVLVLGLGCENNQVERLKSTMPEEYDSDRILFLEAQAVEDEIAAGVEMLGQLYDKAAQDVREQGEWQDIVIGLECGGSDAFSGITANPLIGRASDYIVQHGGTTVLTEVPEMFGAEHILMNQCANEDVFARTVAMINDFKEYYLSHDQPIYENPSPGNQAGGITTLEDKSLGCTRKAGTTKVVDVVDGDARIRKRGLNLLYSPGNDLVATTALGAAGSHLVLFSTGRGTPLGGFIPTVKIASNSQLAARKPSWMDFDAGVLADSAADRDDVLADFLRAVVAAINGEPTSAEKRNDRQIAIFKTGVTL